MGRGPVVDIKRRNGPSERARCREEAVGGTRLVGSGSEETAAILGYARRAARVHRSHLALV